MNHFFYFYLCNYKLHPLALCSPSRIESPSIKIKKSIRLKTPLESASHNLIIPQNMSEVEKQYISYDNVHQLCQEAAERIKLFKPDHIIAIGGGGFIPARILRTFLKEPGIPTIRIFAIILSLYEDLHTVGSETEKVGVTVQRTQWIDYEQCKLDLVGKRILIVDEVDDTRTTLHYALSELEKDAAEQAAAKGVDFTKNPELKTEFGMFVLHDKLKPKKADLPKELLEDENKYIAARRVPDCWLAYPWESTDIVHHTKMAKLQGNDIFLPEGAYDAARKK